MFEKCVDAFSTAWQERHGRQPCWLFEDQLESHTRFKVTKAAMDKGLAMWLLPSNTSHFLQPLDHVLFAIFKKHIHTNKYFNSVTALFSAIPPRHLFWALCFEAEEAAFKKDAFRHAFEATGLFPWNPYLIMSLAEANLSKAIMPDDDLFNEKVAKSCVTIIKQLEAAANGKASNTKG